MVYTENKVPPSVKKEIVAILTQILEAAQKMERADDLQALMDVIGAMPATVRTISARPVGPSNSTTQLLDGVVSRMGKLVKKETLRPGEAAIVFAGVTAALQKTEKK